MEYKGSTPMPDINLLDDAGWHSFPINALHTNIQKVLRDVWKEEGYHTMVKGELSRLTICLHTRGYKCALLYFE